MPINSVTPHNPQQSVLAHWHHQTVGKCGPRSAPPVRGPDGGQLSQEFEYADYIAPGRLHRTARRKCAGRTRPCHTKSGAPGSLERHDDPLRVDPKVCAHTGSEPAGLGGHNPGKRLNCRENAVECGNHLRHSAATPPQSPQEQDALVEIAPALQILPVKRGKDTIISSKSDSEPKIAAGCQAGLVAGRCCGRAGPPNPLCAHGC